MKNLIKIIINLFSIETKSGVLTWYVLIIVLGVIAAKIVNQNLIFGVLILGASALIISVFSVTNPKKIFVKKTDKNIRDIVLSFNDDTNRNKMIKSKDLCLIPTEEDKSIGLLQDRRINAYLPYQIVKVPGNKRKGRFGNITIPRNVNPHEEDNTSFFSNKTKTPRDKMDALMEKIKTEKLRIYSVLPTRFANYFIIVYHPVEQIQYKIRLQGNMFDKPELAGETLIGEKGKSGHLYNRDLTVLLKSWISYSLTALPLTIFLGWTVWAIGYNYHINKLSPQKVIEKNEFIRKLALISGAPKTLLKEVNKKFFGSEYRGKIITRKNREDLINDLKTSKFWMKETKSYGDIFSPAVLCLIYDIMYNSPSPGAYDEEWRDFLKKLKDEYSKYADDNIVRLLDYITLKNDSWGKIGKFDNTQEKVIFERNIADARYKYFVMDLFNFNNQKFGQIIEQAGQGNLSWGRIAGIVTDINNKYKVCRNVIKMFNEEQQADIRPILNIDSEWVRYALCGFFENRNLTDYRDTVLKNIDAYRELFLAMGGVIDPVNGSPHPFHPVPNGGLKEGYYAGFWNLFQGNGEVKNIIYPAEKIRILQQLFTLRIAKYLYRLADSYGHLNSHQKNRFRSWYNGIYNSLRINDRKLEVTPYSNLLQIQN